MPLLPIGTLERRVDGVVNDNFSGPHALIMLSLNPKVLAKSIVNFSLNNMATPIGRFFRRFRDCT